MKAQGIFLASAFLVIAASAVFPAAATGENEAMYAAARIELASLEKAETESGTLGDWEDVISSALFMLFRRTELMRGGMRILVVEKPSVMVKMYPEGTFVLSTGLLDYIDASLFESASGSPRRMRNFGSEREAALFPFLAHEAAHFALGHPFTAYAKNGSFLYDVAQVLESDRFSPVLIALAGYDELSYDAWLSALGGMYADPTLSPVFAEYLADLPSPALRLESIAGSRDNLSKIAAEFTSVLSSLGSGQALVEAKDSLEALRETYPGAPWLDRLDAMVLHRLWLATVPAPVQRLKTFFPSAAEEDPTIPQFLALFGDPPPAFPSPANRATNTRFPGDAALYAAAVQAYRRVAAAHPDSGLESSFAMLLYWTDEKTALAIAEKAAAGAKGRADFTARANYASLLHLTGTDYPRAQFMLDSLAETGTGVPAPMPAPGFELDRGVPGDERVLSLNSALMLRSLGDGNRALAKKQTFDSLYLPAAERGSIALRLISVGDTADDLLSKWGRPAEILYNYVTENWNYPSLSASVLLGRDAAIPGRQVIRRIRFGSGSPLTPGGDLRAGDGRSDFETLFGKPAYRSGDFNVYLMDGNRISVFYLSDTIRNVTAGL